MSFVRLLSDHKGLNPLCSPPKNMVITREVQATEAAERKLLGCG
jgi:hypothetical protein